MITLAKQNTCQRYILKIHSERLRKNKWDLILTLAEARRNEELISLADSQVLRWIDELNGVVDADIKAKELRREIRMLRKEPNSVANRKAIRAAYTALDNLQYKPDYMCLIIDRNSDYYRACDGYTINGIRYRRLLGTNGGIKNSTIVFVSERLYPEIKKRIDNGRDLSKPLVPAKLEAYQALTCSASIPVSDPNGILVVPDCETKFHAPILFLTDEDSDEPVMTPQNDAEIALDASDGFGLMSPALAKRWSDELELGYVTSGVNTRAAFEKGVAFTFDFVDFAEKVAHRYYVEDAWGDVVDIRQVELVLTTSMLKLWDSYDSCADYMRNFHENRYTFGITKTCPDKLEDERTSNYQFLQSYDLSNEDIEELIRPTMEEIEGALGGDWMKMILFLSGSGLTPQNAMSGPDSISKAIMANPNVMNDPYIQDHVYRQIKNRIDEAKVGVLNLHANYSIVSGDPYALCQSMFGMEVTGLLEAGEIYNEYWCDTDAEALVCFRAPMTCHNNIVKLRPCRSDDARYWYQYQNTNTILNAWDATTAALNGCDFDGDIVMLTDNDVLSRRHVKTPTLMCAQRRAEKKVVTEQDLIRSNIESFGNTIGRTTNWITSMFEVQAGYKPGTIEYETLAYRIKCGQLYQQNAIDKAKGIICKPMPREWHDRHAVNSMEGETKKELYRNIVVDRKPYFMKYIYPALMRQYNTYIRNTNRNALRKFQMEVSDLLKMPYSDLTQEQREFLRWYDISMPVGMGDCVMNRICRKFEERFDHVKSRWDRSIVFDHSIYKSGEEYSVRHFRAVQKLYQEYNNRLKKYKVQSQYDRVADDEIAAGMIRLKDEFDRACDMICTNRKELTDILIDVCYGKNTTKNFAWTVCGDQIVQNLLEKAERITIPVQDPDGDIWFRGKRFTAVDIELERDQNECSVE